MNVRPIKEINEEIKAKASERWQYDHNSVQFASATLDLAALYCERAIYWTGRSNAYMNWAIIWSAVAFAALMIRILY